MNCGKESIFQKTWKPLEYLSYRNRCIGRLKTEPGLHTDVKMCEETEFSLPTKPGVNQQMEAWLVRFQILKIIIFVCQFFYTFWVLMITRKE